ncbi:MAG: RidA family protein [Thermogemmatispora sp.]|uniref:RidA family protein n=1 Tax=Thermogemmatispora sp. TaxID=1968838 RepID=UPI00262F9051|nr:RidA family protein [Thermogemmatispora sp.]MBX5458248.1 RidA family protein [Thermogemmatispora sp.]
MERLERQIVSSGSPYEPVIGFARAVRLGNVIAISGTAPLGPDGKTVAPGDAAAQTRRCLEIIQAALEQLGADLSAVIRTRIFLARAEDWEQVGRVHGEFFGPVRPASTMVQVARLLDPEWLVEIEADALLSTDAP